MQGQEEVEAAKTAAPLAKKAEMEAKKDTPAGEGSTVAGVQCGLLMVLPLQISSLLRLL